MPQVAVPFFRPPGHEYSVSRDYFNLNAVTPTSFAHIAWTNDGTDPVPRGHGNQSPGPTFGDVIRGHLQTVTKTYKAIAYKDGYTDSAMVTAVYTIHFEAVVPPPHPVGPPAFDPSSGSNLTFPFTVNIQTTSSGSIIIYTVNDDIQNPSWIHGTHDGTNLDLVLTEDSTLRAICAIDAEQFSSMVVGVYTSGDPALAPPTFDPNGGSNFIFPIDLLMSTEARFIIYTLDGSIPNWFHGTHGDSLVHVTLTGDTTVRAVAANSMDEISLVATQVYSSSGTPPPPPPFQGEGGITVVVSDQDTIFGGVLVQTGFSGTPIFGTPEPVPPGPPITGPIVVPSGAKMIYRPEIDSLAELKAYPSAPLEVDTLLKITIDAGEQSWRVDSGAADPADPGQIAPDDYNASTNDKHYTRVL